MATVKEIMRPARWTIRPDDSLGRAEQIMSRRRIHQLLVVDDGALAGLVSERDVLDYRAERKTEDDWWRAPVRRAMEPAPPATSPDETVATAIDRLTRSPVDVLPVVEHGFLIGQISAADLFEAEPRPPEPAAGPVTVADAMSEPAVSVAPTDSLREAAKLMVDHQVRHLPVVEDGEVIGMLSDRDIRTLAGDPVRFATSRDDAAVRERSVREAMVSTALTVHPSRPLSDLVQELIDEKIGAVPVVDMDGKLVGIVSYIDALRALTA